MDANFRFDPQPREPVVRFRFDVPSTRKFAAQNPCEHGVCIRRRACWTTYMWCAATAADCLP